MSEISVLLFPLWIPTACMLSSSLISLLSVCCLFTLSAFKLCLHSVVCMLPACLLFVFCVSVCMSVWYQSDWSFCCLTPCSKSVSVRLPTSYLLYVYTLSVACLFSDCHCMLSAICVPSLCLLYVSLFPICPLSMLPVCCMTLCCLTSIFRLSVCCLSDCCLSVCSLFPGVHAACLFPINLISDLCL